MPKSPQRYYPIYLINSVKKPQKMETSNSNKLIVIYILYSFKKCSESKTGCLNEKGVGNRLVITKGLFEASCTGRTFDYFIIKKSL